MIMYLKWEEQYSTGIGLFDEQHKRELILLNQIIDAASKKMLRERICIIMDELTKTLDSHFVVEEMAMRLYEFPALKKHRYEHDEIKLKITALHEKCVEGDVPNIFELLKLTTRWFGNHLTNKDINCGRFLINQGYKEIENEIGR